MSHVRDSTAGSGYDRSIKQSGEENVTSDRPSVRTDFPDLRVVTAAGVGEEDELAVIRMDGHVAEGALSDASPVRPS